MDQEPTPPIQVVVRRLDFRGANHINNPGISKNKSELPFMREDDESKA